MKSFKKQLTVGMIILFSISFLFFTSDSLAQEPREESSFSELVNVLNKILGVLLDSRKTFDESDSRQTRVVVPNPACLQHFDSWPSSTTYKAGGDWSLDLFVSGHSNNPAQIKNVLQDLNGDGLVDYIYYTKGYYPYNGANFNAGASCVLLNNGAGWDIAYRCMMQNIDGVGTYYGDCADISK